MAKTIHKFVLQDVEKQEICLPTDAQILSVQMQNEQFVMWVLLDPSSEDQKDRTILKVGTNWDLGENFYHLHISTVKQGSLVWHFFVEYL